MLESLTGKNRQRENRTFFFLLFGFIIFLAYLTVKPVLSMVILALLVASLFYPVYKWFLDKLGGKNVIAVPLTLFSIFLTFIIPVIIVAIIAIGQLNVVLQDVADFAGNSEEIQEILSVEESENQSQSSSDRTERQVQKILDDVNSRLNDLPLVNNPELIELEEVKEFLASAVRQAAEWLGGTAVNVAKTTPVFVTNFIVFVFILASIIPSQKKLKDYILRLSPLDNDIDNLYIKKVEIMANSMVKGTFVIAMLQGLICGILLWLAGVPYVFFWTLLCVFLSIIPNGGAIVNWPIAIALLITGNFLGAAIVILGNLFIVASVDNIMRPMLVSKEAHLPAALTLISVVGGIQVFGFLGFVYGPVIMIFLVTTFNIYVEHYKHGE